MRCTPDSQSQANICQGTSKRGGDYYQHLLSLTLAKISARSAVARHAEHRIVLDDLLGALEHELHAPEVAERRPATLGV
jgi:hypothetical protein